MIKIAITGNIGSGKSEVEKIIDKMGYKTICADKISHFLLQNDEKVKKEVLKIFDTLSREEIAKIVFSDEKKLRELEKIVHPRVKSEILHFFEENKDEKVVFVIVPVLFEAKMENMFDKIVLICADENMRKQRISTRKNYNEENIEKRVKSQIKQEEKMEKADFLIDNNRKIEDLTPQIDKIIKKIS